MENKKIYFRCIRNIGMNKSEYNNKFKVCIFFFLKYLKIEK